MGHTLDLKVCSGPAGVAHLPIAHQAIGLLRACLSTVPMTYAELKL